MSGLIILSPLAVNDAMLTATDVAEADYAAWNNAANYALGDRVIVTTAGVHRIYESLQAANNNHDPTLATPTTPTAWWVVVSATNRWKLLDGVISTRTAKANSFYYEFTPGVPISALHADGIVGATAMRVRMTDPIYGVVKDQTYDLAGLPMASDWWAALFGPWTAGASSKTVTDLPTFPNAVLRVDFTGGANLAVGALLFGPATEWGRGVATGASAGIKDYSTKDTNRWGDTVVTPGEFAKRSRFTVYLTPGEFDALHAHLASLRATLALYIAYAPIGALSVFGFYENFNIVMPGQKEALCEFTVNGVT